MEDKEIIRLIKEGDEQALNYMYIYNLPSIKNYIRTNSGSDMEAEDVFQEAIYAFWRNVIQDKFVLTENSKISTYLTQICHNLWNKELRKKARFTNEEYIDPIDDTEIIIEEEKVLTKRQQVVVDCILKMGESCKNILHLFYIDRVSLAKIAENMGLKNEDVAKTKRYKCFLRLEECVRQNYKY